MRLAILLTCRSLSHRGGSEMHVRDLALALAARGHQVTVWSPEAGALAAEIESAGARAIAGPPPEGPPPDLIHGHQYRELALAMLRHPEAPAVFTCHSARDEESTPWTLPAVRRAIAVDQATAERLASAGFPPSAIATIPNAVDLARFAPRPPLPATPRRALVFSNYLREAAAAPIRAACAAAGIELDLAGSEAGRAHARPEDLLGSYDVVFAKGRCALEAMAVGCAVIVCDAGGLGALVRADDLPALRARNFGFRCLTRPLDSALIAGELARYAPAEAERVRGLVRREADLERAIDATLVVYSAVLEESVPAARIAWRDALPEALAPRLAALFDVERLNARAAAGELATARLQAAAESAGRAGAEADAADLRQALDGARAARARVAAELGRAYDTRTWRLRERLMRWPLIRALREAWVGRGTAEPNQS